VVVQLSRLNTYTNITHSLSLSHIQTRTHCLQEALTYLFYCCNFIRLFFLFVILLPLVFDDAFTFNAANFGVFFYGTFCILSLLLFLLLLMLLLLSSV